MKAEIPPDLILRSWSDQDDLQALTAMLHRAYAPLAEAGLRFTASWQPPETTLQRLSRGYPLVAEWQGAIVGTLTVYPPDSVYLEQAKKDPATFDFGQFGVDPEHKGRGIGRALHEHALDYAAEQGGRFMELDTAAPAAGLIATYKRWGYRIVGKADFSSTNYESVIMRREIGRRG